MERSQLLSYVKYFCLVALFFSLLATISLWGSSRNLAYITALLAVYNFSVFYWIQRKGHEQKTNKSDES